MKPQSIIYIVLLVLMIFNNIKSVLSIIEDDQVEIKKGYSFYSSRFQPFSFEEGGTFLLTLSNIPSEVVNQKSRLIVQFCGDHETEKLPIEGYTVCNGETWNDMMLTCSYGALVVNETVVLSGTVLIKGLYKVRFFSCSDEIQLHFNLVEMNPGTHLSTNEINLTYVNFVSISLWSFYLLYWTTNFVYYRNQAVIRLHVFLLPVIISKLLSKIVAVANLYDLKKDGLYDHRYFIEIIAFDSIFFTLLICGVFFLSKGWCITSLKIKANETKTMLILSILSGVSTSLFRIFQAYLVVAVIIIYVVLAKTVLGGTSYVKYALETLLLNARRSSSI